MSVSGISFWQQDQNWRIARQAQDQQLGFTASLSSVMMSALSNQTTGLASIANQQALTRVNAQIAALQGKSSGASTRSSGGSSTATSTRSTPVSSATNLSSTVTAAALLAGQIPSGSVLSILA
jgi:uncharacterized protein (DUF1684 family)